jgi:hypothetical protein
VAETIVTEIPYSDIAEMIASRSMRGWDHYLSRRQRIQRLGEDVYSVPGSRSKHYRVRYGGPEGIELCQCTDFQVRGGQVPCKHLIAVALLFARRRKVHSHCEVCGVSSHEKTLIGLRGDWERGGKRWCLAHHPESRA